MFEKIKTTSSHPIARQRKVMSYNKVPSPLLTMLPTTLSAVVTGIAYHYKRKPVSLELSGVNQLPMVAATEAQDYRYVCWFQ